MRLAKVDRFSSNFNDALISLFCPFLALSLAHFCIDFCIDTGATRFHFQPHDQSWILQFSLRGEIGYQMKPSSVPTDLTQFHLSSSLLA
jgi:hypothetical protein